MARLALGKNWRCTFANEWSENKAATYSERFGTDELHICDVAELDPSQLPGTPTLVWASFPCQDLSLAGNGAGLSGSRSGTFRPFWKLILGLIRQHRHPKIIVLENVVGTLTSHNGKDFAAIVSALQSAGYLVGALIMDAAKFLPQSRPRLFIVAANAELHLPSCLLLAKPSKPWHTKSLCIAVEKFPAEMRKAWVWWNVPVPSHPTVTLSDLIEDEPVGVAWHTKAETEHILRMMSSLHRKKLKKAQLFKQRIVGTVYRRTRLDENGTRTQRAEIRFDQIAGCLRTPVGGSSRQTIVVVEGSQIRSRLLSPREAARLMGVPESYPIPRKYNDAYHLFGDGLAVPVVSWLSEHLLLPIAVNRILEAA